MRLHIGITKTGGRNNRGRITVRHRGGGHKRLYREIEYTREGYKYNIKGTITAIKYDPNRTAYLARCENEGKLFYKILGDQYEIGQTIKAYKLKDVGIGEEVYNVSNRKGERGKYVRASGAKSKVLKQTEFETVIRLPSGQIKILNNENECNIGGVKLKPISNRPGKAGRSRWKGIRPSVRGVAMNPIDHPNGGKTAGGQSRNLWGKLAKWKPTRNSRLVRV